MYKSFEKGLMPFPGSLSEQPAKLIELFQVFENFINEKKRDAEKKAKQKARRR
jgi:hypothetical protein